MDIADLIHIVKEGGVIGAGGAGFPSYAKIDKRANTIILNGAECEPLLKVDRHLLHKHTYEIISTLDLIAKTVGANEVFVVVKQVYKETVEALELVLGSFPNISLKLLQEVYPTGDEVVLIYDTLKKIVPQGKFPIDIGVTVFNVETMYNIYKAINHKEGLTTKYLTIAGEVAKPVTLKVPIGMTVGDIINSIGGSLIEDPAYFMGGPMTGNIVSPYDTITKTTNAILVLAKDHPVIRKRNSNISRELKKATSTCCQCEMCTNLCPRNLLGHSISPHMFMRNVSSNVIKDVAPYINTLYCSLCGICEMYACPQDLSPRQLIGKYKAGFRENGVTPPKNQPVKEVDKNREYRKVPMTRLISRLGLEQYNVNADLVDFTPKAKQVNINLQQNAGAKSIPIVKKNDLIELGQMIAKAAEDKLSIPLHSSISGKVTEVNEKFIMIQSI